MTEPAGTFDVGIPCPLPDSNTMPARKTTPAARRCRDHLSCLTA
jgi:hypothetical protein